MECVRAKGSFWKPYSVIKDMFEGCESLDKDNIPEWYYFLYDNKLKTITGKIIDFSRKKIKK